MRILLGLIALCLSYQACSNITNCLACNGSKCTMCNDSYYLSQDQFACKQCPSSCMLCSNANNGSDSPICITCTDANMIIPGCICHNGYFMSVDSKRCIACPIYCAQCINHGDDWPICIVCTDPNMTIDTNGQCSCIMGYYFNSNQSQCVKCQPPCWNCMDIQSGAQACTSCLDPHMNPSNKCACYDGYYMRPDNMQCLACFNQCITCISSTICLQCADPNMNNTPGACSCADGYYLLKDQIHCKSCGGAPCLKCVNNGHDYPLCTTCVDSRMQILSNNACVCPNPFFMANSKTTCLACPTRCVQCIGTYQNGTDIPYCVNCVDNSLMILPDCHCEYGYYADSNNDCSICPDACQENSFFAKYRTNLTMKHNREIGCHENMGFSWSQNKCVPCSSDGSCKKCGEFDGQLYCLECYSSDMVRNRDNCVCGVGYIFKSGCKLRMPFIMWGIGLMLVMILAWKLLILH